MNKLRTLDGIELEMSLVLSTAHLTRRDDYTLRRRKEIDNGLMLDVIWLRDTTYGWQFVIGAVDVEDFDADIEWMIRELRLSRALTNILQYCFDRGIRYCHFDADGDQYGCFPVHRWEADPPGVAGPPDLPVVQINPSTLLTLAAE